MLADVHIWSLGYLWLIEGGGAEEEREHWERGWKSIMGCLRSRHFGFESDGLHTLTVLDIVPGC